MNFVLVPGGWQGAWVYEPVVRRLRRHGHSAWAITHAGVERRARADAGGLNLDRHIDDLVARLERENLEDVVLCGHSYGGFVISGVADRVPHRIRRLVYIDAYVPRDGDSCWTSTSNWYRAWMVESAGADGEFSEPHPKWDPRCAHHPIASFLQRVRLSGAWERVPKRDFIYLTGWNNSPITPTYERLKDDPSWDIHVLPTGHNVMQEDPDSLIDLLAPAGLG